MPARTGERRGDRGYWGGIPGFDPASGRYFTTFEGFLSGMRHFIDRPAGLADLDYRQLAEEEFRARGADPFPDLETKRTEDKAFLEGIEKEKTMTRRRLGPRGFGATVLTSPLGITGPAPGPARSLLGMA